jgi:hypothetical protein
MKEHESILHDIHGVSNDESTKETTEFLETKLQELQVEIEKQLFSLNHHHQQQQEEDGGNASISDGSSSNSSRNSYAPGHAYATAEQISLEYVTNKSFRIMFLRSCHYDTTRTATKIIGHFDKKFELFGPSKLCKKITIQDLTEDDLDCFYSGQSQLLPSRDRSGRVILFQALSHYRYKHVINAVRFYNEKK